MKNKNNIFYGVVALAVFLIVVTLGAQVCLGFNKTYAEDPTCQYLRSKQNVAADYTCALGQEYTENGRTLVRVTFNLASSYFDQKSYTFNEVTKETKIERPQA